MKSKKLNLFTKIFVKNLHKGKTPLAKMAEDVGALKGVFSFTGYDLKGRIITQQSYDNLIVNQSKSSIIRLLGQGSTPYDSAIVPTDYRISKIRLSNDTGIGTRGIVGPNKLEYYDITEASNRIAYASNGIFGGGKYGQSTCTPPTGTLLYDDSNPSKHEFAKEFLNSPTDYKVAGTNGKIFNLKMSVRPPSHASVLVKIYRMVGGSEQVIEEIYFNYKSGTGSTDAIYTRGPYSNKPHKIINYRLNGSYYNVSTPMDSNTDITVIKNNARQTLITTNNYTETKIFYDYTSGDNGWKLYLDEINSGDTVPIPPYDANTYIASGENGSTSWSKIEVSFTTGKHNVVNLIIPKTGYNKGDGSSEYIRYGGGSAGIDAYSTTNPSYADCADDYIDDYAVTFGAIVQYNEGNGIEASGDAAIQYTKAYLFCDNDDIFSSINFQTSEFQKNASSAYQLSWKILAPIE